MSFKVCVVTGTRAEYYLLRPVVVRLMAEPSIDCTIAVTGAHLSNSHGYTVSEIKNDGFEIDTKIEILSDDDTRLGVDTAFSRASLGFGKYFQEKHFDLVVMLGDRYEMLAVAFAAINHGIPIAHIHGGELTLGAIDDAIRHSITKMSRLHFASCETYRKRIIQLGERPDTVHTVGALGVENIMNQPRLSKEQLENEIGFSFKTPSFLVTYHPETASGSNVRHEIDQLICALERYPHASILFTKANADAYGNQINMRIEEYITTRSNAKLVANLGAKKYLSALSIVDVVVGNSSSGILETAPFGVPAVNIGDRQTGRIKPENVIDCQNRTEQIVRAIDTALSDSFREKAKCVDNPYGDGHASEKIVSTILKELEKGIALQKGFYDIRVDE